MKGLLIKEPWIHYILSGNKTWEIRGRHTRIRGKIALIQSGSGLVAGTAELVQSIQITDELYRTSTDLHCVPVERFPQPYPKIFAWELSNPIRLEKPIPYHHPQGAVIWVNLQEHVTEQLQSGLIK